MDFFFFYVAQQITAFNLYAEKDPQTRLLEQMEKREIRQKAHIKRLQTRWMFSVSTKIQQTVG